MQRIHVQHEYPLPAARYFELCLDDAYDDALMAHIKLDKERVSRVETPTGFEERLKLTPHRDLPGFLQRVIGNAEHYLETRVWHRAEMRNDWRDEPTIFKDRITVAGTFRILPLEGPRCRRVVEGQLDFRVPLVGGKAEEVVLKETLATFERVYRFTLDWIERHGIR